jgi:ketosteroid isomerase-like protein
VTNAERLAAMYEQFWAQRDWLAARDLFADDIVWIGVDEIGLSGELHGVRAVGGFFRDWLEIWDDYSNDATVEEFAPDVVLVESRFHGRGHGSGIEFETTIGQIWEFRDGKAVRATMYRTPEEAREAGEALVRGG